MSEWQPIDTANKRGGPYILYDADVDEVIFGEWVIDAWYEIGDVDGLQFTGVTHWMPLPEPPND